MLSCFISRSVPILFLPIGGSLPETQNQNQLNTEEEGFQQNPLEIVPTSNILNNKSTFELKILIQSAGQSLVDFTIDPNSSEREYGLAPLEEKIELNLEQSQVIQKTTTNKDF